MEKTLEERFEKQFGEWITDKSEWADNYPLSNMKAFFRSELQELIDEVENEIEKLNPTYDLSDGDYIYGLKKFINIIKKRME